MKFTYGPSVFHTTIRNNKVESLKQTLLEDSRAHLWKTSQYSNKLTNNKNATSGNMGDVCVHPFFEDSLLSQRLRNRNEKKLELSLQGNPTARSTFKLNCDLGSFIN